MNCRRVMLAIAGLVCLLPVDRCRAADEPGPIVAAKVELGRAVDFERDIFPIIEQNCLACHNKAVHEGDLILEDSAAIFKGGASGPAVVAGKPDESYLLQVASRKDEPAMPPLPNDVQAKPLTPEQVGLIQLWIQEGAKGGSGTSRSKLNWQPVPDTLTAVHALALSNSERFVAVGRANRIAIYELSTGRLMDRLTDPNLAKLEVDGKRMNPHAAHRDLVHSLAFSPDGTLLASGGYRNVKLWSRANINEVRKSDVSADVASIAISADGQIAVVGASDGTVTLWQTDQPQPAASWKAGDAAIVRTAVAMDGSKAIAADANGVISMWDTASKAAAGSIKIAGKIRDLIWLAEGSRLVVASEDAILRVYPITAESKPEAETAAAAEWKGHSGPIPCLAQGTGVVVSGSEDGTLRSWKSADGAAVHALQHKSPVAAAAVTADGQSAFSAGADGVVRQWQLSDAKMLAEFKGVLSLQHKAVTAIDEHEIAKQHAAAAKAEVAASEKDLKDREEGLKKVDEAVAESGKKLEEAKKKLEESEKKLAEAKAKLDEKKDDENLKKAVTTAEEELKKQTTEVEQAERAEKSAIRSKERTMKNIEAAKVRIEESKAASTAADAVEKAAETVRKEAETASAQAPPAVTAIAIDPKGGRLVTQHADGLVQLWNVAPASLLQSYTEIPKELKGLSLASDRFLWGAVGKSVTVWDIDPQWQLAATLGANPADPLDLSQSPFIDRILALDFSPNGELLATGGGEPSRSGEVMLWNVAERKLVTNITDAHSDTVFGLDFSHDGKQLLSGAADKFAKVFDVATGKLVRAFEGHTHHVLDVAWKADSSAIATAGADNAIKVWNTSTGDQNRTINKHTKEVTSIRFLGTGNDIVTCSGDKTVWLHRVDNGSSYRSFAGCPDYVYAATATRDMKTVIAAGEDGAVRVWDGTNGQLKQTWEPPAPAGDAQANAAK